MFLYTEVAAGFAVENFPSSLIIIVVCLLGVVAEDERFEDLDGMCHDEACSAGLTIKHLALGDDLTRTSFGSKQLHKSDLLFDNLILSHSSKRFPISGFAINLFCSDLALLIIYFDYNKCNIYN